MPRKPTGNPRGRPTGTGRLGEQTRFTVRIPTELYARLEAFAEGRSYTRGTPQLAGCVREALAHYLVCPHRRQTQTEPVHSGPSGAAHQGDMSEMQHTSQPGKRTEATHEGDGLLGEETRQTRNVPEARSAKRRQTKNNPEAQRAAPTATRPAPSPPPAPPRQRRQAKRQAQPA
jgi:predicted transcriptional regulator